MRMNFKKYLDMISIIFKYKLIVQGSAFLFAFLWIFPCYAISNNINDYLNNSDYFYKDIDINHDGIVDRVFSHNNGVGDDLLFFKKKNNNYELVLKSVNLSEDGGNWIRDIKQTENEKYVMIITTAFPIKENVVSDYFISYEDKRWFVTKIIHTLSGFIDDYTKSYICEFDNQKIELIDKDLWEEIPYPTEEYVKEHCQVSYYMESTLSEFAKRFDENDPRIVQSVERYKQLLHKFPYTNKTKSQYLLIKKNLKKMNLNDELIYLDGKVTQFKIDPYSFVKLP